MSRSLNDKTNRMILYDGPLLSCLFSHQWPQMPITSAFTCPFYYPFIYLKHMLFDFLLSSHSDILWVPSVLVLSAARLLSLPVRCHNSFHDSSVLSLWRAERLKQEQEHARHQHSNRSSLLLLYFPCQEFEYRQKGTFFTGLLYSKAKLLFSSN